MNKQENIMTEEDIMEECAELLRKVQEKLETLSSKDEEWNKNIREELEHFCSVLVI